MLFQLEDDLIQAALTVRENAYAPYSNFLVGAAIGTSSGSIWTGCNFENASYGLSICAERGAVAAMIAGGEREIAMVAVASRGAVTPCGACRQVLVEFGMICSVLLIDCEARTVRHRWSMNDLLPQAFTLQS